MTHDSESNAGGGFAAARPTDVPRSKPARRAKRGARPPEQKSEARRSRAQRCEGQTQL